MHLGSLTISRFRSFEEVTISLRPDLTVLVGENNGEGRAESRGEMGEDVVAVLKLQAEIGRRSEYEVVAMLVICVSCQVSLSH